MHELTASEAATVLAVLSKDGGRESSDLAPSGIPTSTFFATRRKIYDAGWLSDRYVPNPWAIGIASVDCVLAHPGPTERGRLERAWTDSPETVVLWSGLNVLFGVFFRRARVPSDGATGLTLSVTEERGSIPVYFDYSRLWSRFVRLERATGYPRSLGDSLGDRPRLPVSTAAELFQLDANPPETAPRSHRWHSASALSRSQQRALERGLLQSRTVLNVDALPPYDDRALGEIVLISGRLRDGATPADVLGALNQECRVSPLFLAEDGGRLLLVALGQVRAGASPRAKLPRAERSVSSVLDASLTEVQMTVEHTDSVRKLVDHRYDRLIASPSTAGP